MVLLFAVAAAFSFPQRAFLFSMRRVAPTGSRLYRRLVIGLCDNAKRAANPRYSRLPVGATRPRSMEIKNLNDVPAFLTKDGSEIRELLAYRNSAIRNQSLAEARLPPGSSTQEHYHSKTEEIYFITHGNGRMKIEDEVTEVKAGDSVAIPPGKKHKLWNTGSETLRLLCCCAPCYEHSDTILTE